MQMRIWIFAFGFLLLSSFAMETSSSLSAEETQGSELQPRVEQRIVYREKSYFDFEDTLIRGDRPLPDGSSVFRKDRVKFRSQLNLERSFMPELKSSAQDAR